MKEILYLDTDLIHSYLAQINNGLMGDTTNERGQLIQNEKTSSANSSKTISGGALARSGKIKVPLLFDTPDGEVEIKVDVLTSQEKTSGEIQTEDGREIISKRMHDNALNNFEEHLEINHLVKPLIEASENEYVKFQSPFQVFNITYLKTITDPEALKRTALAEQNELLKNLLKQKEIDVAAASNNAQKNIVKRQYDELINPVKEFIDTQVEGYININFLLGYLENILPTKTFMKFDNSVALCKENFIREDPNILMFKYPQMKQDLKLTVLGKKTRKISASGEAPTTDSVFNLFSIIDELMTKVEIASEDNYIISPIAIYFE